MAREKRFRKREFQDRLARARKYERRISSRWFKRYVFLAIALVVLYYLAISPRFLVVEASVNPDGPSPEVVRSALANLHKKRLWLVVPSNHILVLDKTSLVDELGRIEPSVRSVKSMGRSWPNHLSLNVDMREARYVWQTGLESFLLDQDGVIFERIPTYTPETFSQDLIVDRSASAVTFGEDLAVEPILDFVEEVREQWPLKINTTNVVSYEVPALRSKDVIVKTGIGFSVFFDLSRAVAAQLDDLRLVMREQIRPETYEGLSYIDLRLPAVAYYCYKDAPCAPEYTTSTIPVINPNP